MKRLLQVVGLALFFTHSAFAADAPAAPPLKICTFPDAAAVTLSINKGDVDAMLTLLQRGPDGMTVGQYKALGKTLTDQVAALQAKYCK